MTEKLTLAVNHALNDVRLARARALAFNPGMGLDAKRESAWCEYGFKEELTFYDLYKLYRRGGIAHGSVNKLTGTCWQTNPEIIDRRTRLTDASDARLAHLEGVIRTQSTLLREGKVKR